MWKPTAVILILHMFNVLAHNRSEFATSPNGTSLGKLNYTTEESKILSNKTSYNELLDLIDIFPISSNYTSFDQDRYTIGEFPTSSNDTYYNQFYFVNEKLDTPSNKTALTNLNYTSKQLKKKCYMTEDDNLYKLLNADIALYNLYQNQTNKYFSDLNKLIYNSTKYRMLVSSFECLINQDVMDAVNNTVDIVSRCLSKHHYFNESVKENIVWNMTAAMCNNLEFERWLSEHVKCHTGKKGYGKFYKCYQQFLELTDKFELQPIPLVREAEKCREITEAFACMFEIGTCSNSVNDDMELDVYLSVIKQFYNC